VARWSRPLVARAARLGARVREEAVQLAQEQLAGRRPCGGRRRARDPVANLARS
jgi:hypothetical protein